MMRPSPLYRRLGLTGPTDALLSISIGGYAIGDRASEVSIVHDGELSRHSPATATVTTPEQLGTVSGDPMTIVLTPAAAAQIASLTGVSAGSIVDRFRGRAGALSTTERARPPARASRRETRVSGASWSSVLANAAETIAPSPGMGWSVAAATLFTPSWAPAMSYRVRADSTESWYTAADPLTASDLISQLEARLWLITNGRDGVLQLESLSSWESRAAAAADIVWPLARAHVLSPTDWTAGGDWPTATVVTYRAPGTPDQLSTWGALGDIRPQRLDWTETVAIAEQWRRVDGLRWASRAPWALPAIRVRLDHLLASSSVSARRAAGMLLSLHEGDPIALAGDWPPAFQGINYVRGIQETITAKAWEMTISLAQYGELAGLNRLAVPARTWDQATVPWDSATTTWNEGKV